MKVQSATTIRLEVMAQTPKVKGPASYFPSIEKTYGEPIPHWMGILKQASTVKHMELVNLLKTQHQLGHEHANALVAHFLAAAGADPRP